MTWKFVQHVKDKQLAVGVNMIHELLEIALRNLEECENDPKIQVDYYCYHLEIDGKIYVNLPGAYMRQTMKLEPEEMSVAKEVKILSFLNHGKLVEMFRYLGIKKEVEDVRIVPYTISRRKFKYQMLYLIDYLKDKNL